MFRRILVASDLSDASRPAIRLALDLGAQLGASVVVLHVIEAPPEEGEGDAHVNGVHALATVRRTGRREEAATRQQLERQTRTALPGATLPATESIVRSGAIVETIVTTAEAGEADLVVVGAGHRPGLLGSVAAGVVQTANRPVLAVPAEEDEDDEQAKQRDGRGGGYDARRLHDRGKPDAVDRA